MIRIRLPLAALLITGLAPAAASAQSASATTSRWEPSTVSIQAVRIDEAVTVDGRLDDEVYSRIAPMSDFVQQEPREGQPATERTDVWVMFDDRTLYVSGRCWDSAPERRVANEMRRDNDTISLNDNFGIALDTFRDQRNAYMFHGNPIGGMTDGLTSGLGGTNKAWNTVWRLKTGRFEGGWTIEMAIPFRSLRYETGGSTDWGIQIRRIVSWKNEVSFITAVPAVYGSRSGLVAGWRFATLKGLELPAESQDLEVKPYGTSSVTTAQAQPRVSNDLGGDWGVDAKYGITRGLTADVTYNTDFAQVEDDEQQVNLTRFSLFFPEKRDFFLEGSSIFAFGGATGLSQPSDDTPILFFSRRIGLENQQVVPTRGGGRVTGRAGPYSLAGVDIYTGDAPNGKAPGSHFSVARVKRDILRRSNVGVLMARRAARSGTAPDNMTYGVDAALSFYNTITVNLYGAKTTTGGVTGRDTSYKAYFDYAADRYGLQVEQVAVGGNFKPEVGFVGRRDMRRTFAQARFSPRPTRLASVRKFTYQGSLDLVDGWSGGLQSRLAKGTFKTDFQNGDSWNVDWNQHREVVAESFTVVGVRVLPGAYDYQDVQATYTADPKHWFSGTFVAGAGHFYDGTRPNAKVTGRLNFPPRVVIEPSVSLNWVRLSTGRARSTIISTRTSVSLSPQAFIGALVQYSSSAHTFGANVRLRWEYSPGSELFVIYNEGRDTNLGDRLPLLQNRSVLIKLTRLFRL